MKIMKIISDCIDCSWLFSDGIGKDSILFCAKASTDEKTIKDFKSSFRGIPDWCPLEDYEVKK